MRFPEQFRYKGAPHGYASNEGDRFGVFFIPPQALGNGKKSRPIRVIANDGAETGWDHVSASLPQQSNATPSWSEMCLVKSLFWDAGECVVQFHPAAAEYVNHHNGCLHLWKMHGQEFPTPPTILV